MDNPTKPANEPSDATTYSITDGEVHNKIQDGLCDSDVSAMERNKLEGVHIGAGCGAALSTKQLQQATIVVDVPLIILGSGTLSTCVKPPAEEMQTPECGEYT